MRLIWKSMPFTGLRSLSSRGAPIDTNVGTKRRLWRNKITSYGHGHGCGGNVLVTHWRTCGPMAAAMIGNHIRTYSTGAAP